MEAQPIVQMDGKKTRLYKPRAQCIRDNGRENFHDYTFDHSYWSFDDKDENFSPQEQVYADLGTDVVDCAFEGKSVLPTIIKTTRNPYQISAFKLNQG